MRSYVDHQGLNPTKLHDLIKSLSIVEQEDIFQAIYDVRNSDDNTILHFAALLDDEITVTKYYKGFGQNPD